MRFYSLFVVFAITVYNVAAFFHHVTSYGNQHHYSNQRHFVMKLEYRNAKLSDISSISELCSESFDGPFQWHQQIQRLQSIDSFKVQLTDRLNNLVSKGVKHCMIVAVDSEKPEKSSVVGFLEVGLLPSPIGLNEPAIIRDETLLTEVSDAAVTSEDEVATELSNIPASSDVLLNSPVMMKIEDDVTNNVANSIGSSEETVVVDENQNSDVEVDVPKEQFVDPNELVLAAAALEAEQRRKNKREEVPYLGNVAVSQDCRRQGVGMKLVRIGLKVVEKWGDEKLFVVVESDNSAAIKMYEKLKFSLVLKEEDNINRRMDRVPRIFMSIEVPKKVQIPLDV